jgi:hypothetical protein
MALVVSERLPEVGRVVVSAVVATTILFELVGPVLTRRALHATGEAD